MIRAAALLLVSAAAFASDAPDVKGIRIGATESEVRAILPALICKDRSAESQERFCVDPLSTLAGHPARFSCTLRDGRLVTLTAIFPYTAGADVRNAAIAKFGQPGGVDRQPTGASVAGVTVIRHTDLWPRDDQMLVLTRTIDGRSNGYLVLSSQAELDRRKSTPDPERSAREKDF